MAESRNPAGYEKQKLYQSSNTPSQRVTTHAEMLKVAEFKTPMIFVVDNDEKTGGEDVLYYWSGIEVRSFASSAELTDLKVVVARKLDNWQVDTFADAQAFSATLSGSAFIEVIADETQSGVRALYFWNTSELQEPLLL